MTIAERLTPGPLNLIERIRGQYSSLSKTHLKVADFILENYDKMIFLSSAKMAQKCGVSESSVIRFAMALGYSGYSEMQCDLQEMFKRQISLTQRLNDISENSHDSLDIFYNVLQKSVDGIQQMGNCLDGNSFSDAVDLLSDSERVFLIGSRSSYGMVHFLGLNLGWIRRSVYVINGEGHEFDLLSSLTPKDVVLAISLPNYLKSTVHALEYAFQKKACTICITDTITSPIVRYSTVPLLIHSEILSYSDNILPIACLITALLNAVGAKRQTEAETVLSEREEFWRECDIYAKI